MHKWTKEVAVVEAVEQSRPSVEMGAESQVTNVVMTGIGNENALWKREWTNEAKVSRCSSVRQIEDNGRE